MVRQDWLEPGWRSLIGLVSRDLEQKPGGPGIRCLGPGHSPPPGWEVARLPLSEEELAALLPLTYRLRFPEPWEQEFQRSQFRRSLPYIRVLLWTFTVGFWVFGLSDQWGFPHSLDRISQIRYHLVGPVLVALGLGSLGLRSFGGWRSQSRMGIRWASRLSYLLGGLGILAMIAVAHPEDPGFVAGFTGLVFPIFLSQFSRLGSRWATALGVVLWLGYGGVGLWRATQGAGMASWSNPGVATVGGNLFYLGFINVAAMAMGYLLEVSARVEFLQRQALAYERERSERLLANILPESIVALLKEQPELAIAQEYPMASILFADLVNFTPLAEQLPPTELVSLLDEIFSEFDHLVEAAELEKIKTIGDCYMVAAGVPVARADHGEAIAHLALDMMRVTDDFAQRRGHPLKLRIGIHSGSVVAGVIGRKKFLYDLWGDTVNTASRMESHGKPGQIQLSEATYELIKSNFTCQSQGLLPIKGKGRLPVWQLQGRFPD